MANTSIRAVIFDFGGVLVRTEDWSAHKKWENRLGLKARELEEMVFMSEVAARASIGQVGEEDVWKYMAEKFALDEDQIRELERDFWSKEVFDTELAAFLRDLRPRYKTAVLSNAWLTARDVFNNTFGIGKIVDEIIVSAEEGMKKPDIRIFQRATQRLGVRLEEAIFVDDFVINVEAACSIGMKGIQYKSTKQVIADVNMYLEEN